MIILPSRHSNDNHETGDPFSYLSPPPRNPSFGLNLSNSRNAASFQSAEKNGLRSSERRRVSGVSAPLATSILQMSVSALQPRDEKNTSDLPSGDHVGWTAATAPATALVTGAALFCSVPSHRLASCAAQRATPACWVAGRSVLNPLRISVTKSSGCSHAAKCPPFGSLL